MEVKTGFPIALSISEIISVDLSAVQEINKASAFFMSSFDEISEVDKNINEETSFDFKDTFDSTLPELNERQLVK